MASISYLTMLATLYALSLLALSSATPNPRLNDHDVVTFSMWDQEANHMWCLGPRGEYQDGVGLWWVPCDPKTRDNEHALWLRDGLQLRVVARPQFCMQEKAGTKFVIRTCDGAASQQIDIVQHGDQVNLASRGRGGESGSRLTPGFTLYNFYMNTV